MIRHILLVKFKDTVMQSEVDSVKALLEKIPEKIEGVMGVEWGMNDSLEGLNQGYTHAVMMTFADEEARQSYLPHPEHEAIKSVFVPLLEDIVVFDYSR